MDDILKELEDAQAKFKNRVEQLFGKIETTDFADAWKELSDVHDKLQALSRLVGEAEPSPKPETESTAG